VSSKVGMGVRVVVCVMILLRTVIVNESSSF